MEGPLRDRGGTVVLPTPPKGRDMPSQHRHDRYNASQFRHQDNKEMMEFKQDPDV